MLEARQAATEQAPRRTGKQCQAFTWPGSQFSTPREQLWRSASWDTTLRMSLGLRAKSHLCCLEGATEGWSVEEGTRESPG